jgi:L-lactate dehydrogenase complex protein LldG
MSASQNVILGNIKRALASAHLPAALPVLPPQAASTSFANSAALAESFTRELTALRGKVHQATSPADALELTLQILKEAEATELLAWEDTQLPVEGLGAAIRAAGYSMLEPTLPTDAKARREKLAGLGRATVGITGAMAGLADTGTLVLTSGPGRPRLASLLPPVHIALLPVGTMLPSLPDLFVKHTALTEQGSNLIFITGPSRTSDIELTAVYGVHGPKTVHVILI